MRVDNVIRFPAILNLLLLLCLVIFQAGCITTRSGFIPVSGEYGFGFRNAVYRSGIGRYAKSELWYKDINGKEHLIEKNIDNANDAVFWGDMAVFIGLIYPERDFPGPGGKMSKMRFPEPKIYCVRGQGPALDISDRIFDMEAQRMPADDPKMKYLVKHRDFGYRIIDIMPSVVSDTVILQFVAGCGGDVPDIDINMTRNEFAKLLGN